jgi:hypothetical protein
MLSESIPGHYQVVIKHDLTEPAANAMRADIVRHLLAQIVSGLRPRLKPAQWLNGGWSELQAFVEALCTGGMHPVLTAWEESKNRNGKPTVPGHELSAQRVVLMLCTALERVGVFESKIAIRRFVAAELQRAGLAALFNNVLSESNFKHWQERNFPRLDPNAEVLIATSIATAGRDKYRLVRFFTGLIHLNANPTAVLVPEGSSDDPA